jgi:ribosome-associated toxin RatA of RatAB toxin-antitoxin module
MQQRDASTAEETASKIVSHNLTLLMAYEPKYICQFVTNVAYYTSFRPYRSG